MLLAEKIVCLGKAGIGSCADNDFEIGEPFLKLPDDGHGRVYFADTDSMDPDTFFSGFLRLILPKR